MKIYGIGTDIVKVSRIKNSLKKSSFLSRIYNRSEVVKCKRVKNPYGGGQSGKLIADSLSKINLNSSDILRKKMTLKGIIYRDWYK